MIRAKHRIRAQIRPDGDGPLAECHSTIGHEHRRVGPLLDAQSLADRTPTERTVERKVMGCQFVKAPAARVANAMLTKAINGPARLGGLVAHPRDMDNALTKVKC